MNTVPLAPANASAEQAPGQATRFLGEIAQLLDSSPPPEVFYAEFLRRVSSATRAVAAGLWSIAPQSSFQRLAQIDLPKIGLEQIPDGPASHAGLLRRVVQGDRPLLAPPNGGEEVFDENADAVNRTEYFLVLVPLLIDKQPAGVLEVWLETEIGASPSRGLVRFLTQVAGFAAAYLHRDQWKALLAEQQLWARLEGFTRRIHASLEPSEVAYRVANEARTLLACDQVCVAVKGPDATRVEAISGTTVVDRRSRLAEAMKTLCARVMDWGEKLIYAGERDGSLPPDVFQALDGYLAESSAKLLIVLPLRGGPKDDGPCRSAILAECVNPTFPREQLESRLDMVGRHAGSALHNALELQQLPLARVSRLLRGLRGLPGSRAAWKAGVVVALVAAAVTALAVVPTDLRLTAKGQLLPVDRQTVYAPLGGKVVELKALHGDLVGKDQELLFLEDLDTQLQVDQLALKAHTAEQRLALLSDRLAKATGEEERTTLTNERINQDYELRKARAERDVLLRGSRNPRKSPVAAPLPGRVVTFDAQQQLLGKTVKPGDPLVRIARTDGAWEVELDIPENHVGPIRDVLAQRPSAGLDVDLLVASQPQHTYRGRLFRDGLGGETVVKDNAVVLPARVRITDPELLSQVKSLPVGVDVHAKIHCGRHSVGYAWFYELAEFFYEHVAF